jgi:hypothetical protein
MSRTMAYINTFLLIVLIAFAVIDGSNKGSVDDSDIVTPKTIEVIGSCAATSSMHGDDVVLFIKEADGTVSSLLLNAGTYIEHHQDPHLVTLVSKWDVETSRKPDLARHIRLTSQ